MCDAHTVYSSTPLKLWTTIVSPLSTTNIELLIEHWTGIRSLPPNGDYTDLVNLAVLHYDGAADGNPTTDPTTDIPTSSSALVETNLHVRSFRLGILPSH